MSAALSIRPATASDLPRCAVIWRDALNDYLGRLNLPEIPDQLEGIGRVHAHTLATDPDRFVVAERRDPNGPGSPEGARIVAFASALDRGPLWFLSMLFVDPEEQAQGLGRRLLDRVLPTREARGRALAAVTDSAQPISNGLYASYGVVPRMPLAHIAGRPERAQELAPLPEGISVVALADGASPAPAIDALDRDVLGFDHPSDHRHAVESGRRPYLVQSAGGEVLGYGYASPVGTIGPIAVRDAALLAPVAAHLLRAVEPRGALALWVPGAAGETFEMLIRSGLRIDGFPLLIGWSRPFADFSRYVPLSPGLL